MREKSLPVLHVLASFIFKTNNDLPYLPSNQWVQVQAKTSLSSWLVEYNLQKLILFIKMWWGNCINLDWVCENSSKNFVVTQIKLARAAMFNVLQNKRCEPLRNGSPVFKNKSVWFFECKKHLKNLTPVSMSLFDSKSFFELQKDCEVYWILSGDRKILMRNVFCFHQLPKASVLL